jgi:cytoskeletal protein CcmA (bactofilin family)
MSMKRTRRGSEAIESIIGKHVYFEGILTSKQGIRIDGRIKGNVECEGLIIIGSEGRVDGEIVAHDVYIAGELTGNATARNRLEITEQGKVYGDITAAKLVVGPGVILEGKCHMIAQKDTLNSSDTLSTPASLAAS